MDAQFPIALLVSDDEKTFRWVQALLSEEGHRVFHLEYIRDISDGIRPAGKAKPSAILLDLNIPEEEQLDRLAQIRSQAPDLPIVVLNGSNGKTSDGLLVARGAQDSLPKKGLTRTELLRSLHHARQRQDQLNRLEQTLVEFQSGHEQLQTIIDQNADGIIVVDHKGIIRFANQAAERLFGYRARNLRGRLMGHIVGKRQWVELDVLREDGSNRMVELHLVAIIWQGQPAFLVTIRDVTESRRLLQQLQESFDQTQRILEETTGALASAVEIRDPFTAGHQRRVARLTSAIAGGLGIHQREIVGVRLAAQVHDIGKICVPSQILNKPGRLRDSEFDIVKEHPRVGHDILKSIEFPWPVAQMVMQHHERLDGSGYPCGLSEMDILPGARIIAVADVVDAMSSARTYRAVPGTEKALQVITRYRGLQFDARVVDVCNQLFKDGKFQFE